MNIGVLGSGFIVEIFIRVSGLYRDFHLRGIWGRHEDKLLVYADKFDYHTTDLEKLLDDEKIDVVYVALPNALHYEYAMKALKKGKHVILEKPFTVYKKEAKKLIDYAAKHDLIIFEAITTIHNPLYKQVKKRVEKLENIKMVDAKFCQYSRRYDRFKNGIILPVFNKDLAGGALLDLNVYNIHFVTGLFGKPKEVRYFPNIERGVDTSGVLILDYGKFKATLIAGKDNQSDNYALIEAENGYIRVDTAASRCGAYTFWQRNGKTENVYEQDDEFGGWKYEMKEFIRLYKKKDLKAFQELNKQTLLVADVLERALEDGKLNYERKLK